MQQKKKERKKEKKTKGKKEKWQKTVLAITVEHPTD
jgi:hypothetical protein